MKLKHNALMSKKLLALMALSSVLCSCTLLQADGLEPTASSSANRANAGLSVAAQAAQTEMPLIGTAISDEQQALIDEINRDGDALQFDGFRDTVPAPEQPSGEDVVELNYEQVDLRVVLEELAEALDISIVIDPSIDNKVSLRTSGVRPLAQADIWPLIRMLTRDAGVVLDRVGNIYNARKIQGSLPVEIVTADTLGQGTAARIMQVTPLTYVSAEAALQVIEPLLAPDGEVREP